MIGRNLSQHGLELTVLHKRDDSAGLVCSVVLVVVADEVEATVEVGYLLGLNVDQVPFVSLGTHLAPTQGHESGWSNLGQQSEMMWYGGRERDEGRPLTLLKAAILIRSRVMLEHLNLSLESITVSSTVDKSDALSRIAAVESPCFFESRLHSIHDKAFGLGIEQKCILQGILPLITIKTVTASHEHMSPSDQAQSVVRESASLLIWQRIQLLAGHCTQVEQVAELGYCDRILGSTAKSIQRASNSNEFAPSNVKSLVTDALPLLCLLVQYCHVDSINHSLDSLWLSRLLNRRVCLIPFDHLFFFILSKY